MFKVAVSSVYAIGLLFLVVALISHSHRDEVSHDFIGDIIRQDIQQLQLTPPVVPSQQEEAVVMDDLPPEDRAELALFALRMELPRLGFPIDTDLDNVRRFVFMIKQAESAGDRYAKSTANAMSFYQFKPDSVITAVNRFENWTKRHELVFPSWADSLRQNPVSIYDLQESLQAMLMMINIIQQSGSDAELIELIRGEAEAAKELYYVYHHTAPDYKTIRLIERVFDLHFNL